MNVHAFTMITQSIEIKPSSNTIRGFSQGESALRYTPVTLAQEELLLHKNINYEERGLSFPRFLENMFSNDHYRNKGIKAEQFKVRFVQDNKVKVIIGITMYQEPCGGLNDIRRPGVPITATVENFADASVKTGGVPGTLLGIMENIRNMTLSGPYSNEDFVVCLIADGRTRINGCHENLSALERMGLYHDLQEVYSKSGPLESQCRLTGADRYRFETVSDSSANRLNPRFTVDDGETVYVHLFENVVQYGDYPPLQVMFALKEFNAGKLDSHLWLFEGFSHHMYRVMNKDSLAVKSSLNKTVLHELYVVCLDAGTRPDPQAICKLVTAMECDDSIAGCCGEIAVDRGLSPANVLYNWTIAAQVFEYKVGNIIDKAFESFFGFISVLPGAFSAYRWSALSPPHLGPTSQRRPIVPYFKSVTHGGILNPFYGNMFLAEDRVLCLELVCSTENANILKFVKGAKAFTDVPSTVPLLMKQRRRWLNGSFFAQLFALQQAFIMMRIWSTKHTIIRKIALFSEFSFLTLLAILQWFLVGLCFLSFTVIWRSALVGDSENFDPILKAFMQSKDGSVSQAGSYIYTSLRSIYLVLLFTIFLLAMGTAPDSPSRSLRALYRAASLIFGFTMLGTLGLIIWILVSNGTGIQIIVFSCTTCGFLVPALFYGEALPLFATFIQSIFMQATYINIFHIFAFCNTHDLSWGTKGLDVSDNNQKHVIAQRNEFRTLLVLSWVITNFCLVYSIERFASVGNSQLYLSAIVMIAAAVNALKIAGSFLYLISEALCKVFNKRKPTKPQVVKRKQDWRKGTPYEFR